MTEALAGLVWAGAAVSSWGGLWLILLALRRDWRTYGGAMVGFDVVLAAGLLVLGIATTAVFLGLMRGGG